MKNKVQLITYADRLGDGTIKSMTDILRTRFDGVYDGVHILPFFTPFDGADAGFDPIDHTKVDERLGSWDDVAELSKTHDIMVDAIVNHMSWESKQFQDVLAKGEESEYYPMFLTMSSVFPNGATEEDLAGIYRPRPGLPFTHYKFAGKTRLVWVSFTPQQVDIDTDSDKGWEYLMSIFDQMAASHVSYIRLDAVGYGAKEAGTSCFMTPKTFKLISRLREEGVKRGLEILIEVHSYYKKQVEIASKVDRVYDFALPPLLLHALSTGHVEPVAHWTDIRPNNAVTVLDTHDGIGVIDIGSDQLDRSLKGHRRRRIQSRPLPGQQHLLFGARMQRPALHRRPCGAVLPAGRAAGLLCRRACRQERHGAVAQDEQRPRHQPPLLFHRGNRRESQASGR